LQSKNKVTKKTSNRKSQTIKDTCVTVEPGICGFPCLIRAGKLDARTVSLEILGSDCQQIQKLSERLNKISLKELFTPISRNPVYSAVEKSGCHLSCAIPTAIFKAAEVAMDMALPRDVCIKFEACDESIKNEK
jgi:hypothetical protein